jgi:hypothetical protein
MTDSSDQRRLSLLARATLVVMGGGWGVASADPGDHIRVGEATIIPSLDVGLEYRTNPLQLESQVVGGANMRIAPRVDVAYEIDEIELKIGGQYELRKYFSEKLIRLDRFSDFSVNAGIELLPQEVVGFRFSDVAGFRNNASGDDAGSYHSQFRNRFDGAAVAHIGPTLGVAIGGFYGADNYFVPVPLDQGRGSQSFNYRDSYGPTLNAEWSFFPRTALVVEGEHAINKWGANLVGVGNPNQPNLPVIAMPNSRFTTVQAGLRGRITERLVVVMMAGYGAGVYDETSVPADTGVTGFDVDIKGLNGLLITTQAQYDFGVGQRLSAGYRKSFADMWFTNFVTYNEIYGRFDGRIGSRLTPSAAVSMRYEDYYGQVARNDIRLSANGFMTYNVQDYARLTGGVSWIQRASFQDSLVEYDDFNFQLMATFTY